MVDAASAPSSAVTATTARPSAGTITRHRALLSVTARTANATATTSAPPPSSPSRFSAIVVSASSATAPNANRTEPLTEQLRAEQGRHEQQRLQQVRDAVEAARQLGPERRERERPRMDGHHDRVGGEDAHESRAERGPRAEEARAEDPSGDGAESEQHEPRRRRAAGRPAEREVRGQRGAERGGRAGREEEGERDEEPEHEQRRRERRAARHLDPRLQPQDRCGRVAARSRMQRVRRLQRRARHVRHRDEPRNAREARRQRPVPARAEHGDRVARPVLRRPFRRQSDDDQRPVPRDLVRLGRRGSARGRAAAAAARCRARRAPSRRTRRRRSCAGPHSARAGRPRLPVRAPGCPRARDRARRRPGSPAGDGR